MKVSKQSFVCGLVYAAMSVVAAGCVHDEDPSAWALSPGDRLPHFEVTTLGGEVVSDESFAGGRGAIVLFSTECADCRRELPRLEQEYRQFCLQPQSADFMFICISRAESEELVAQFWQQNELTMPVAAVADRSVYDLFAASGVPRLFLTDCSVITASYLEELPANPFTF